MGARGSSAGRAVLRSLLLFTPLLAVALVVLGFIVFDIATEGASGGNIAVLVFVGFVSALLLYQVVQSLRDVFSNLMETTGLVERSWSRNDLLLFRSQYLFLNRTVFRVGPEQALDVQLGDTVRIVHYPHTGAVESVEVTERAAGERSGRAT